MGKEYKIYYFTKANEFNWRKNLSKEMREGINARKKMLKTRYIVRNGKKTNVRIKTDKNK